MLHLPLPKMGPYSEINNTAKTSKNIPTITDMAAAMT
jgi:hypothetical protein